MASSLAISGIVQNLGPGGGGQPLWGLNDQGFSSSFAPLFFTDPWDTFWIGTRQMPGECNVLNGAIAQIEINKKKGKGTDGARLTLAGYDPGEFPVTVEITTAEQWAELQDIVDIYWTIPNKGSTIPQVAVTVYHPNLAWLKIYSAVLKHISPMAPGKVEGSKMTTLTFQENVATKKHRNVTKSAGPPAEAPQLPNSNQIGGSTAPPSANAGNASTSGPSE